MVDGVRLDDAEGGGWGGRRMQGRRMQGRWMQGGGIYVKREANRDWFASLWMYVELRITQLRFRT